MGYSSWVHKESNMACTLSLSHTHTQFSLFPHLFNHFFIYINKDSLGYHFSQSVILCYSHHVFCSYCPNLASGIFKLAHGSFDIFSSV